MVSDPEGYFYVFIAANHALAISPKKGDFVVIYPEGGFIVALLIMLPAIIPKRVKLIVGYLMVIVVQQCGHIY